MKLYAYRRAGRIEFETCPLPLEAGVTDFGTIEVTEPGTHKASEIEWSDGNIEYRRMSNRHDNTYNSGFRSAERIFAPKKTVTKEANIISHHRTLAGFETVTYEIPSPYKNLKPPTYEVEER
jgi:hypothetical protein